jgi:U3 small nucleolar RNA-associated protein 12
MGITKQYLRYVPSRISPFGVIASPNAVSVFVNYMGSTDERFIASSGCEDISVWDTKTGERVKTLSYRKHIYDNHPTSLNTPLNESSEVVCLRSNGGSLLAAGHANGVIRVWDLSTGALLVQGMISLMGLSNSNLDFIFSKTAEVKQTLNGHKSAVTCLAFDTQGLRLASGSKDTVVIVWDIVSETGLFRLRGHKHVITQVAFTSIDSNDILISSSRDTFVKFWDLSTQHCFKTLIGHRNEVWDFVFLASKNWLITGTIDSELRIWELEVDDKKNNSEKEDREDMEESEVLHDEGMSDESFLVARKVGSILRKSTAPVKTLTIDAELRFLACHGKDSTVEVFKIRTEEEIKSSMKKRIKKEKKRALDEEVPFDTEEIESRTMSDQIECLPPLKTSGKVKHVDILTKGVEANRAFIVVTLSGNSVEVFGYSSAVILSRGTSAEKKQMQHLFHQICLLNHEGHRTDMRVIAFSSDSYFIMTASTDCIKIWSRSSGRCVVSIDKHEKNSYSLCGHFAPGDKNVLIGTKEGTLQIFDVSEAKHNETIQASEEGEAIWSMDVFPSKKGCVTGSEDKTLKFWDFDLVSDDSTEGVIGPRRLTIKLSRQLKLEDGVIAVKVSPNQKLVAASLLDSTVKVFFFDSLKFFLNMYGHKYPVIAMDISSDSTLLATGSSDKNIKVWGLDFGDCHKSMFAHAEPVTSVNFVPNTHYCFSAGKDGSVKQWDCDTFDKIVTLKGHLAEIWSSTVSPNGKFVASISHDRSIRIWEKTNEPLVLQEEQEMEQEEEEERQELLGDSANPTPVVGDANRETGLAGKKTSLTLKGTELLMEAVEIHQQEMISIAGAKKTGTIYEPHAILSKFKTDCPDRFVLETIRSIKSCDLEESLISLPFSYAADLLRICKRFFAKDWEYELVNRVVLFLTRVHFSQISSTRDLVPVMENLGSLSIQRSQEMKRVMGVNLAALRFLQDKINERQEVSLFAEAFDRLKDKKKNKNKSKKSKTIESLGPSSAPVLSLM